MKTTELEEIIHLWEELKIKKEKEELQATKDRNIIVRILETIKLKSNPIIKIRIIKNNNKETIIQIHKNSQVAIIIINRNHSFNINSNNSIYFIIFKEATIIMIIITTTVEKIVIGKMGKKEINDLCTNRITVEIIIEKRIITIDIQQM